MTRRRNKPDSFVKATLLAAALAVTARAGVTADRIPAEKAFGDSGKKYTASLHDLEADDLVAEFARQTGIVVRTTNNYVPPPGGPVAVYELDFADLSAFDAVAELARALGLRASPDPEQPDGFVVSTDTYGPQRQLTAAGAKAEIDLIEVSRQQTLPASPNEGPPAVNLTLQLTGANAGGSPSGKSAVAINGLTVEEAVDEQGRKLDDLDAASRNEPGVAANRSDAQLVLRLGLPSPRPAKLSVRGTCTLGRPKTVLRVAVDEFDDRPMSVPCEGGTFSVGPPVANGRGFNIKLGVLRGGMDSAMYERMRRLLTQQRAVPLFRGPDGEPLRASVQGTSWSDDRIEIDVNLTAAQRTPRPTTAPAPRPAQPPAIRPKTMLWDVVVETTDEPVKFEFKDVRVP